MEKTAAAPAMNVEAWRDRIRADTVAKYHLEMGIAIVEKEGDLAAAIEHFRKAVAIDPRKALGHYLLSETLRQAGNVSEAEKAAVTARAILVNYEEQALCFMVLRCLSGEQVAAARRFADLAVQKSTGAPDSAACSMLTTLASGDLAGFTPVPAPVSPDLASAFEEELLNVGYRFQNAGKQEAALAALLWLDSLNSELADVPVIIAQSLYRMGKLPDALVMVDRAIAANPINADALVTKGQVLTALSGDSWETVVRCTEQAIALQPDFLRAHIVHWLALTGSGRPMAALRAIEHYAGARGRSVAADQAMVRAYHIMGDIAGALAKLGDVPASAHGVEFTQLQALQHLYLGRPDQALSVLRPDSGGVPENSRLRVIWYLILNQRGDDIPDLGPLEADILQLPYNWIDLVALAALFDRLGQSGRAEACLKQGIANDAKRVWMATRYLHGDFDRLYRILDRIGFTTTPAWPVNIG